LIDTNGLGDIAESERNRAEVEFLFATIEAYLGERQQPDGLRKIFAKYEGWIRRQSWYTPSWPGWFALEK